VPHRGVLVIHTVIGPIVLALVGLVLPGGTPPAELVEEDDLPRGEQQARG
jgi:hypothetical protein